MISETFLEYGVAVSAIAGLIYVVKKALCVLKRSEENTHSLISNHLHDSAEASHKLQLSNQELSLVIKELLSFLRRSNGSK